MNGSQRDFPARGMGSARFIRQSGKLLLGKALEDGVDGLSAHIQVAGDALFVPAFKVQLQNDFATLDRVRHVGVACVARID